MHSPGSQMSSRIDHRRIDPSHLFRSSNLVTTSPPITEAAQATGAAALGALPQAQEISGVDTAAAARVAALPATARVVRDVAVEEVVLAVVVEVMGLVHAVLAEAVGVDEVRRARVMEPRARRHQPRQHLLNHEMALVRLF